MAVIYFIMYLLQGLSHLLYWLLLVGVPALILWQAIRHRHNTARLVAWLLFALVWATPAMVERWRDHTLRGWVATLPPAPIVQIPQGSRLTLQDGMFDPKFGQLLFARCHGAEYAHPFCSTAFGPEVLLQGITLGLTSGAATRALTWRHAPDCPPVQRYLTAPEPFTAYFTAQGICSAESPVQTPQGFRLTLDLAEIPYFPGVEHGQLHLLPEGATDPATTLTSFAVIRPKGPALWGAHWLPVLAGLLPDVTTEIRHGQTFDEATMTGYPPGSLQNLVLSQGWNAQVTSPTKIWAGLDTLFPYDANRALPALRSNAFFPSRFALELVCAPGFAPRITPQALAEIERIAAQSTDISNGLPNRLAREGLASGCGMALRD